MRSVVGRAAASPYGHVDEATHEYVINRPDTPTPWLNYLGQGGFGGIISNTAGGFSFDRDPRARRATRYRYNAIPADQPGRYVYLRDQETGRFWSPTWQPVRGAIEAYECRPPMPLDRAPASWGCSGSATRGRACGGCARSRTPSSAMSTA